MNGYWRQTLWTTTLAGTLLLGGCRTARVEPAPPLPSPTATATIPAPSATAVATPRPTAAAANSPSPQSPAVIDSDRTGAIDLYLRELVSNRQFMGSVLIAQGGEIVLQTGYGFANTESSTQNDTDTIFRIGSLSKQFTAAAVLRLHEQGKLDLHAPLSEILPAYPNGARITIHHLLSHTAGIPDYIRLPIFRETVTQPVELDALLGRFQELPLEYEPGAGFSYSNSGYMVLTKVIEVVSGISYADAMQQELFQPLGLQNSGVDDGSVPGQATGYVLSGTQYTPAPHIDMSIPVGAGAIYSSSENLHRWVRSLQQHTLLSEASVDLLFTAHARNDGGPHQPPGAYGYGWILDTDRGRIRYNHSGDIFGYAAYLAHYPDDDITVILLSNVGSLPLPQVRTQLSTRLFQD